MRGIESDSLTQRTIKLTPMLRKRPHPKALLLALALNAASQATYGEAPLHGLNEGALIAEYGLPQSKLSHKDTTIFHYPGQSLTLQEGRVVSSRPNQLQNIESVENKIAAKKNETSLRQLKRYRNSTELSHLSPIAIQEFWLRFQQRYPEIDVSMELAASQLAVERQERRRLESEIDELKEAIADLRSTPRTIYRRGYEYRGYAGYRPERDQKHYQRNAPRAEQKPVERAALIPKTKPLPANTHRFAVPSVRPVDPLVQ